jgi:signal transduction histidine kinase
MRTRLLRSTLAIALVAVVTLGVPLLLVARHQVWTSARDGLRQQAASVAAGLEDQLDARRPVDVTRYAQALPHRRIVVVTASGSHSSAGPTLTGAVLQSSVTVTGNTITVQAARGPTVTRAREVSLLVLGLALLAVAAAVGLALAQARRLTRPLSELLDRADALGRGEFTGAAVDSGIAEIDGISRVLERSARQLGTVIELQRDFASDAAHQLRTPLTGIGLRLDELTRIGDSAVRDEAEDALAQVTRLDRVISVLLARARGDAAEPTTVDLASLLGHEAQAWSRALAKRGRALVLEVPQGLVVHARREHLAGVLSCLLDNALQHGAGTVRIVGSRSATGAAQVTVTDQGSGVPADLAEHVFDRRVSGTQGTGIGLALARSLAAAEGGQLTLVEPNRFVLSLPLAPQPTGTSPGSRPQG